MTSDTPLLYIKGNESGDMDSILSAFVLSQLLQTINPKVKCVPVISCCKEDFKYLIEARTLFDVVYNTILKIENFVFLDSPIASNHLNSMYEGKKIDGVRLMLVDHMNEDFHGQWTPDAANNVVAVIDHHDTPIPPFTKEPIRCLNIASFDTDVKLWMSAFNRVNTWDAPNSDCWDSFPTICIGNGSYTCSSMVWVAKLYMASGVELPGALSTMIQSTILKDSKSFDPRLRGVRWNDEDLEMYRMMGGSENMKAVADKIKCKKEKEMYKKEVGFPGLLRMDKKVFHYPNGQKSVWCSIDEDITNIHSTIPSWKDETLLYLRETCSDFLVILATAKSNGKKCKYCYICSDSNSSKYLSDALCKTDTFSPSGESHPIMDMDCNISRKILEPIVRDLYQQM